MDHDLRDPTVGHYMAHYRALASAVRALYAYYSKYGPGIDALVEEDRSLQKVRS